MRRLVEHLKSLHPLCRVLELGTRRWHESPTHHKEWVREHFLGVEYVRVDRDDGLDVDAVADAHCLERAFDKGSFDAVIACSVFEHLACPWIAAGSIAHVVRPGGLVYVQTHQTFPLHNYPSDYWRFTTEAMGVLFARNIGWELLLAEYDHPCKVTPLGNVDVWNFEAEAFLNVVAIARRLP